LGDKVIEVTGPQQVVWRQTVLVENLTFNLPPAGIVGVIGPNGAGKTTLFKMLTGQEKPDSGSVYRG
jgi:sulfate-transporting ATPase